MTTTQSEIKTLRKSKTNGNECGNQPLMIEQDMYVRNVKRKVCLKHVTTVSFLVGQTVLHDTAV